MLRRTMEWEESATTDRFAVTFSPINPGNATKLAVWSSLGLGVDTLLVVFVEGSASCQCPQPVIMIPIG